VLEAASRAGHDKIVELLLHANVQGVIHFFFFFSLFARTHSRGTLRR
jgi:hypothetical protein